MKPKCISNITGKKFFAGDVFGIYGYTFADLGEHDFAEEILKPVKKAEEAEPEENSDEPPEKRQKTSSNDAGDAKKPQMETVVVKIHASFVPLAKAFEFDWKAKANERQLKRLSETYPILR